MKLELIHRGPAGQARPTPLLFVHGKWHGGSEGRGQLRWTSIADYVADVEQVAEAILKWLKEKGL